MFSNNNNATWFDWSTQKTLEKFSDFFCVVWKIFLNNVILKPYMLSNIPLTNLNKEEGLQPSRFGIKAFILFVIDFSTSQKVDVIVAFTNTSSKKRRRRRERRRESMFCYYLNNFLEKVFERTYRAYNLSSRFFYITTQPFVFFCGIMDSQHLWKL